MTSEKLQMIEKMVMWLERYERTYTDVDEMLTDLRNAMETENKR